MCGAPEALTLEEAVEIVNALAPRRRSLVEAEGVGAAVADAGEEVVHVASFAHGLGEREPERVGGRFPEAPAREKDEREGRGNLHGDVLVGAEGADLGGEGGREDEGNAQGLHVGPHVPTELEPAQREVA